MITNYIQQKPRSIESLMPCSQLMYSLVCAASNFVMKRSIRLALAHLNLNVSKLATDTVASYRFLARGRPE